MKSGIKFFALTLLLAVAFAFTTRSNNAKLLVTQGYEKGNCNTLQNIDGGFNCGTGGSTICKISGVNAYNTQANCQNGSTVGLLLRTP